jgi:hypothetical protein
VQPAARWRPHRLDAERLRRRIVQNQPDVREQTMSGGKIDDPPAAKDAADPARHLPRLVELFARQTAGVTHRAGDSIEQRGTWKPLQVTIGEASFR